MFNLKKLTQAVSSIYTPTSLKGKDNTARGSALGIKVDNLQFSEGEL